MDLLWLKNNALEDSEDHPEPEVLAAEIVEKLERGDGRRSSHCG